MSAKDAIPGDWERLAGLRPRLQASVRFHRHAYRGEPWYVAQDLASGRSLRLSPDAYQVAIALDGRSTLRELAEDFADAVPEGRDPRAEIMRAVRPLLAAQFLHTEDPLLLSESLRQHRARRRLQRLASLRSPLVFRIPLLDPDRFLVRTLHWVQPAFTGTGAWIWSCVVLAGALTGFLHWSELTHDITDRVLATQNLLLLSLVFPVVKAIHEFGHAYATRTWGGEVHEMGVMFLVFMPIPYVDASSSTAFREKHRRLIVGAAGMGAELFVASLAMFAWVNLEPGLLRSIAYNTILIASVSTLVFNANPLLRYDGYYIFSDLIETPNLASRSVRTLGHWIQTRLFGVEGDEPRPESGREGVFLGFYAVISFVYRMGIFFGIALFVASKYFFVGVVLALWAVVGLLGIPLAGRVRYLARDPRLGSQRRRAIGVTAGVAAGAFALVTLVPVPLRTLAEGVVWFPDDSVVRATVDGFATQLLAEPGAHVQAGQPLLQLRSPELETEARALAAQLREQQVRYASEQIDDRAQAELTREAVDFLAKRLERVRERQAELTIRSPADGQLTIVRPGDLPGRFLRRGDPVGYVFAPRELRARVIVAPSRVDLVRQRTHEVAVRLSERLSQVLPARLAREVPAATQELPSAALGLEGGGDVALDPQDPLARRAFERLFQFELEIDAPEGPLHWGQRVHVRFDHGASPLASQWYRSLRQLFLTRLHV